MARSEQEYINLCKKQIEEKFCFGNGQGYTQRDLELLSVSIEEKTRVVISLSTLKRLWKDNYKQSPQIATLDSLAQVLGYKGWRDFKDVNQGSAKSSGPLIKRILVAVLLLAIAGVLILAFSFQRDELDRMKKSKQSPKITGPITFEASKTVPVGIPNTVIFKYDVSNVEADSFYLQQSWNYDHRVGINPKGNAVSSIYYESGYHRAKLIANDSVIATQPVHIISDGWEPHIYHSESDPELIDFKNEKFVGNGVLHIDRSILKKRGIDFLRRFNTRITNSRNFDVHSDSFSFITRMKADSVFDQLCGWMDLIIVTEVQTFSVSWTEKGCEKYAGYKLGEILKKGADNDLSALGCDIYGWQKLEIRVKDRLAEIHLNGKMVYSEKYQQNFGKIVSLIYLFDGTGSIDYARLKDGRGKIIFDEGFGD